MSEAKYLWNLFTSKAEYEPLFKDKFKRVQHWGGASTRIFEPEVSDFLLRNGFSPKYPDNKKFALCVTHDVDVLYPHTTPAQLVRTCSKELAHLRFKSAWSRAYATVSRNIEPHLHLSETFRITRKHGARSSFYFLSLGDNEEDFNYDVEHIKPLFELIDRHDGEVGLHGGHMAYNNVEKMVEEKLRLQKATGKKIEGYRNHYLRFETPTTWECLSMAGFNYDTTFGYADCAGFRNGMCYPFEPYSLRENKFLNITELPLIIMDVTLWRYMLLDEKMQIALCKKIIDTIAHYHGVLTLLWHNNQMQGYEGTLLNNILQYCKDAGAWMPHAGELVSFWNESKYNRQISTILGQLKEHSRD